METRYFFEAVENGITKMKLHNRGHPTGFSKILGPLLKIMMKKANKKDLKKIKAIIEGKR